MRRSPRGCRRATSRCRPAAACRSPARRSVAQCRSRRRSTSPRARRRRRACGCSRCASRSRCGSSGSPQRSSTRTTSAPHRRTTSHMRSPNTPFAPTIAVSPGSRRFTKHASMPAEPVPEIGQRQRVVGTEHRPEARHGLVENREELGIHVTEQRTRQRGGGFGVRVRRAGPEEQAVGDRHAPEVRAAGANGYERQLPATSCVRRAATSASSAG